MRISGRGMASLEELRELAQALVARKPKDARIAAIRHVEAAAKAAARHRHPVPEGGAAEISVAQGGPVLRPRDRASGQKRVP